MPRGATPLAALRPFESPYAGFGNNPIYFVDPSGLTPTNGDEGGDGGKKLTKAERRKEILKHNALVEEQIDKDQAEYKKKMAAESERMKQAKNQIIELELTLLKLSPYVLKESFTKYWNKNTPNTDKAEEVEKVLACERGEYQDAKDEYYRLQDELAEKIKSYIKWVDEYETDGYSNTEVGSRFGGNTNPLVNPFNSDGSWKKGYSSNSPIVRAYTFLGVTYFELKPKSKPKPITLDAGDVIYEISSGIHYRVTKDIYLEYIDTNGSNKEMGYDKLNKLSKGYIYKYPYCNPNNCNSTPDKPDTLKLK